MLGNQTQPSVIVYGPEGVGKTTNRDCMRIAFGLSAMRDDWDETRHHFSATGVLYLTEFRPRIQPYIDGSRVMAYADAMQFVADEAKRRQDRLVQSIADAHTMRELLEDACDRGGL